MQQSIKFGPFMNIMCVKCMDMIALDVIQSLHLIQSLNLHTKSTCDCCGRKMISFLLYMIVMDEKCFPFFLNVIVINEINKNNYDMNVLWK
jgi:hypothetical protein